FLRRDGASSPGRATARGVARARAARRRTTTSPPASRLRGSGSAEPVAELGVPRRDAPTELVAQLADGAGALGDDVVPVDRLEVDLLRVHEVPLVELRIAVEDAFEREPDGVLDEARLQVRVLDDEQLVRALHQLVDRRAHRALDDLDEVLCVHR